MNACPACGERSAKIFFRAKGLPVQCNRLWPSAAAARAAPRGDMELAFCEACGLVFNAAFDPAAIEYGADYETSLHFSPAFRDYAAALAERLVATHGLAGKSAVEIGCGAGEFLSVLRGAGLSRVVGFEPGRVASPLAVHGSDGVTIIADHYRDKYRECGGDLIVCRHVLEHLAEPLAFLKSLAGAPVLYLEVPNRLAALPDGGVWDVIYEHVCYFDEASLGRLVAEAGFAVRRVAAAFGGQFLCLDAVASGKGQAAPSDPPSPGAIETFAAHRRARVDHWAAELARLSEAGRRVALWGAGSKGVTFLTAVPGAERIQFVIDLNARKQGRHVPLTGQRVHAPDEVPWQEIDVVIAMNPLYGDEIAARVRAMGGAAEVHPI